MTLPRIPFGRTGHHSSRIIFGGFAVAHATQAEANQILDWLLEVGINHLDTAPSYGESELRIGAWLPAHRDRFFLATKTGERSYAAAYAEIQRSLERLQTNQIDLIQLHNLVDPAEWTQAMAEDGAFAAAQAAQRRGYVRYIGVTGHGMSVAARHLATLDRVPLDAVLLPYNYRFMEDGAYAADFEALMTRCARENVAVQTIKAIARGRWGDQAQRWGTWYEPLEAQEDIDAAVHFVLQRPGIFLNSAGDPELLRRIVAAAARYESKATPPAIAGHLATAGLRPLFPDGDDI